MGGDGTWPDLFVPRLVDARAHPAVAERLTSDVLARVDEAIGLAGPALRDSGTPTLVDGDVWDGNLMVRREDGRWRLTGLLDPDLQFADVEFELAYLEVFDVPHEAFFVAYADHQTLRPGYERRRLFYWLHTALVHVALFGDESFCHFTSRTAERIGQLEVPRGARSGLRNGRGPLHVGGTLTGARGRVDVLAGMRQPHRLCPAATR